MEVLKRKEYNKKPYSSNVEDRILKLLITIYSGFTENTKIGKGSVQSKIRDAWKQVWYILVRADYSVKDGLENIAEAVLAKIGILEDLKSLKGQLIPCPLDSDFHNNPTVGKVYNELKISDYVTDSEKEDYEDEELLLNFEEMGIPRPHLGHLNCSNIVTDESESLSSQIQCDNWFDNEDEDDCVRKGPLIAKTLSSSAEAPLSPPEAPGVPTVAPALPTETPVPQRAPALRGASPILPTESLESLEDAPQPPKAFSEALSCSAVASSCPEETSQPTEGQLHKEAKLFPKQALQLPIPTICLLGDGDEHIYYADFEVKTSEKAAKRMRLQESHKLASKQRLEKIKEDRINQLFSKHKPQVNQCKPEPNVDDFVDLVCDDSLSKTNATCRTEKEVVIKSVKSDDVHKFNSDTSRAIGLRHNDFIDLASDSDSETVPSPKNFSKKSNFKSIFDFKTVSNIDKTSKDDVCDVKLEIKDESESREKNSVKTSSGNSNLSTQSLYMNCNKNTIDNCKEISSQVLSSNNYFGCIDLTSDNEENDDQTEDPIPVVSSQTIAESNPVNSTDEVTAAQDYNFWVGELETLLKDTSVGNKTTDVHTRLSPTVLSIEENSHPMIQPSSEETVVTECQEPNLSISLLEDSETKLDADETMKGNDSSVEKSASPNTKCAVQTDITCSNMEFREEPVEATNSSNLVESMETPISEGILKTVEYPQRCVSDNSELVSPPKPKIPNSVEVLNIISNDGNEFVSFDGRTTHPPSNCEDMNSSRRDLITDNLLNEVVKRLQKLLNAQPHLTKMVCLDIPMEKSKNSIVEQPKRSVIDHMCEGNDKTSTQSNEEDIYKTFDGGKLPTVMSEDKTESSGLEAAEKDISVASLDVPVESKASNVLLNSENEQLSCTPQISEIELEYCEQLHPTENASVSTVISESAKREEPENYFLSPKLFDEKLSSEHEKTEIEQTICTPDISDGKTVSRHSEEVSICSLDIPEGKTDSNENSVCDKSVTLSNISEDKIESIGLEEANIEVPLCPLDETECRKKDSFICSPSILEEEIESTGHVEPNKELSILGLNKPEIEQIISVPDIAEDMSLSISEAKTESSATVSSEKDPSICSPIIPEDNIDLNEHVAPKKQQSIYVPDTLEASVSCEVKRPEKPLSVFSPFEDKVEPITTDKSDENTKSMEAIEDSNSSPNHSLDYLQTIPPKNDQIVFSRNSQESQCFDNHQGVLPCVENVLQQISDVNAEVTSAEDRLEKSNISSDDKISLITQDEQLPATDQREEARSEDNVNIILPPEVPYESQPPKIVNVPVCDVALEVDLGPSLQKKLDSLSKIGTTVTITDTEESELVIEDVVAHNVEIADNSSNNFYYDDNPPPDNEAATNHLDLLAAVAADRETLTVEKGKRGRKKGQFSTSKRSVKKNPGAEQTDKRITRSSTEKTEVPACKPHDFLPTENSVIPKNNVYTFKSPDVHITSEDSNDSEGHLLIDEGNDKEIVIVENNKITSHPLLPHPIFLAEQEPVVQVSIPETCTIANEGLDILNQIESVVEKPRKMAKGLGKKKKTKIIEVSENEVLDLSTKQRKGSIKPSQSYLIDNILGNTPSYPVEDASTCVKSTLTDNINCNFKSIIGTNLPQTKVRSRKPKAPHRIERVVNKPTEFAFMKGKQKSRKMTTPIKKIIPNEVPTEVYENVENKPEKIVEKRKTKRRGRPPKNSPNMNDVYKQELTLSKISTIKTDYEPPLDFNEIIQEAMLKNNYPADLLSPQGLYSYSGSQLGLDIKTPLNLVKVRKEKQVNSGTNTVSDKKLHPSIESTPESENISTVSHITPIITHKKEKPIQTKAAQKSFQTKCNLYISVERLNILNLDSDRRLAVLKNVAKQRHQRSKSIDTSSLKTCEKDVNTIKALHQSFMVLRMSKSKTTEVEKHMNLTNENRQREDDDIPLCRRKIKNDSNPEKGKKRYGMTSIMTSTKLLNTDKGNLNKQNNQNFKQDLINQIPPESHTKNDEKVALDSTKYSMRRRTRSQSTDKIEKEGDIGNVNESSIRSKCDDTVGVEINSDKAIYLTRQKRRSASTDKPEEMRKLPIKESPKGSVPVLSEDDINDSTPIKTLAEHSKKSAEAHVVVNTEKTLYLTRQRRRSESTEKNNLLCEFNNSTIDATPKSCKRSGQSTSGKHEVHKLKPRKSLFKDKSDAISTGKGVLDSKKEQTIRKNKPVSQSGVQTTPEIKPTVDTQSKQSITPKEKYKREYKAQQSLLETSESLNTQKSESVVESDNFGTTVVCPPAKLRRKSVTIELKNDDKQKDTITSPTIDTSNSKNDLNDIKNNTEDEPQNNEFSPLSCGDILSRCKNTVSATTEKLKKKLEYDLKRPILESDIIDLDMEPKESKTEKFIECKSEIRKSRDRHGKEEKSRGRRKGSKGNLKTNKPQSEDELDNVPLLQRKNDDLDNLPLLQRKKLTKVESHSLFTNIEVKENREKSEKKHKPNILKAAKKTPEIAHKKSDICDSDSKKNNRIEKSKEREKKYTPDIDHSKQSSSEKNSKSDLLVQEESDVKENISEKSQLKLASSEPSLLFPKKDVDYTKGKKRPSVKEVCSSASNVSSHKKKKYDESISKSESFECKMDEDRIKRIVTSDNTKDSKKRGSAHSLKEKEDKRSQSSRKEQKHHKESKSSSKNKATEKENKPKLCDDLTNLNVGENEMNSQKNTKEVIQDVKSLENSLNSETKEPNEMNTDKKKKQKKDISRREKYEKKNKQLSPQKEQFAISIPLKNVTLSKLSESCLMKKEEMRANELDNTRISETTEPTIPTKNIIVTEEIRTPKEDIVCAPGLATSDECGKEKHIIDKQNSEQIHSTNKLKENAFQKDSESERKKEDEKEEQTEEKDMSLSVKDPKPIHGYRTTEAPMLTTDLNHPQHYHKIAVLSASSDMENSKEEKTSAAELNPEVALQDSSKCLVGEEVCVEDLSSRNLDIGTNTPLKVKEVVVEMSTPMICNSADSIEKHFADVSLATPEEIIEETMDTSIIEEKQNENKSFRNEEDTFKVQDTRVNSFEVENTRNEDVYSSDDSEIISKRDLEEKLKPNCGGVIAKTTNAETLLKDSLQNVLEANASEDTETNRSKSAVKLTEHERNFSIVDSTNEVDEINTIMIKSTENNSENYLKNETVLCTDERIEDSESSLTDCKTIDKEEYAEKIYSTIGVQNEKPDTELNQEDPQLGQRPVNIPESEKCTNQHAEVVKITEPVETELPETFVEMCTSEVKDVENLNESIGNDIVKPNDVCNYIDSADIMPITESEQGICQPNDIQGAVVLKITEPVETEFPETSFVEMCTSDVKDVENLNESIGNDIVNPNDVCNDLETADIMPITESQQAICQHNDIQGSVQTSEVSVEAAETVVEISSAEENDFEHQTSLDNKIENEIEPKVCSDVSPPTESSRSEIPMNITAEPIEETEPTNINKCFDYNLSDISDEANNVTSEESEFKDTSLDSTVLMTQNSFTNILNDSILEVQSSALNEESTVEVKDLMTSIDNIERSCDIILSETDIKLSTVNSESTKEGKQQNQVVNENPLVENNEPLLGEVVWIDLKPNDSDKNSELIVQEVTAETSEKEYQDNTTAELTAPIKLNYSETLCDEKDYAEAENKTDRSKTEDLNDSIFPSQSSSKPPLQQKLSDERKTEEVHNSEDKTQKDQKPDKSEGTSRRHSMVGVNKVIEETFEMFLSPKLKNKEVTSQKKDVEDVEKKSECKLKPKDIITSEPPFPKDNAKRQAIGGFKRSSRDESVKVIEETFEKYLSQKTNTDQKKDTLFSPTLTCSVETSEKPLGKSQDAYMVTSYESGGKRKSKDREIVNDESLLNTQKKSKLDEDCVDKLPTVPTHFEYPESISDIPLPTAGEYKNYTENQNRSMENVDIKELKRKLLIKISSDGGQSTHVSPAHSTDEQYLLDSNNAETENKTPDIPMSEVIENKTETPTENNIKVQSTPLKIPEENIKLPVFSVTQTLLPPSGELNSTIDIQFFKKNFNLDSSIPTSMVEVPVSIHPQLSVSDSNSFYAQSVLEAVPTSLETPVTAEVYSSTTNCAVGSTSSAQETFNQSNCDVASIPLNLPEFLDSVAIPNAVADYEIPLSSTSLLESIISTSTNSLSSSTMSFTANSTSNLLNSQPILPCSSSSETIKLLSSLVTSQSNVNDVCAPENILNPIAVTRSELKEKDCMYQFNEQRPSSQAQSMVSDISLALQEISPGKLSIGSTRSLDLIPSRSIALEDMPHATVDASEFGNGRVADSIISEADKSFTRPSVYSNIVIDDDGDHNYTVGGPLVGGRHEEKNILSTNFEVKGLTLGDSPDEFPLNDNQLPELTLTENNLEDIISEDLEYFITNKETIKQEPGTGNAYKLNLDNAYAVNNLVLLGNQSATESSAFPLTNYNLADIECMNLIECSMTTSEENSNSRDSESSTTNMSEVNSSWPQFTSNETSPNVVVLPVERCQTPTFLTSQSTFNSTFDISNNSIPEVKVETSPDKSPQEQNDSVSPKEPIVKEKRLARRQIKLPTVHPKTTEILLPTIPTRSYSRSRFVPPPPKKVVSSHIATILTPSSTTVTSSVPVSTLPSFTSDVLKPSQIPSEVKSQSKNQVDEGKESSTIKSDVKFPKIKVKTDLLISSNQLIKSPPELETIPLLLPTKISSRTSDFNISVKPFQKLCNVPLITTPPSTSTEDTSVGAASEKLPPKTQTSKVLPGTSTKESCLEDNFAKSSTSPNPPKPTSTYDLVKLRKRNAVSYNDHSIDSILSDVCYKKPEGPQKRKTNITVTDEKDLGRIDKKPKNKDPIQNEFDRLVEQGNVNKALHLKLTNDNKLKPVVPENKPKRASSKSREVVRVSRDTVPREEHRNRISISAHSDSAFHPYESKRGDHKREQTAYDGTKSYSRNMEKWPEDRRSIERKPDDGRRKPDDRRVIDRRSAERRSDEKRNVEKRPDDRRSGPGSRSYPYTHSQHPNSYSDNRSFSRTHPEQNARRRSDRYPRSAPYDVPPSSFPASRSVRSQSSYNADKFSNPFGNNSDGSSLDWIRELEGRVDTDLLLTSTPKFPVPPPTKNEGRK